MRTLSFLNVDALSLPAFRVGGRLSAWVERSAVLSVLLVFFLLSLCYSVVVPPFETPDEIHHYAFARHLAQGNPLPVQIVESSGLWEHEGTQAPLYYLVLGRLIAGIDQSDFDSIRQINPHANLGNPLYPGNKNYMLYSAVSHPLTGTNLAVHVGRWFSLCLMLLALLLVYGIARMAFPHSPLLPVLAVCTVAAIPQVQFISATVSNDTMVILLGAAVTFWLARLASRSDKMAIRWYEWGLLGVLLGLAALSKLQGLGLIPLSMLVVVGLAWLRSDRWLPLKALLPVALPILLIAGWWYWRNYTLYGEWLGVDQLLSINGQRQGPYTFGQLWGELRGVRYSFWGLFGWFSILMPNIVYTVLDWISVMAVSGVIGVQFLRWRREGSAILQRPEQRVHFVLFTWSAMLFALLLYWLTFATSGQGRLLFPALGAVGVFIVMGMMAWLRFLPLRWRAPIFALLPAGLLAASLYVLIVLLPAHYQAPAAINELPPGVIPQGLIFGDAIELVAMTPPQERYQAGDRVEVTLYWRALVEMTSDYPLFLQLLTLDQGTIGNVTTHPGWGRFPTTLWKPGELYADRYEVQIEGPIGDRSPLLAVLTVGFFSADTNHRLPIHLGDGEEIDQAVLATMDILPTRPHPEQVSELQPDTTDFGGLIQLTGYAFDKTVPQGATSLPVVLSWEAIAMPEINYTAFVHLIDADGNQIDGYDQPPAENRFPTSHWQPGDWSLSTFPLSLPADLPTGTYEVWVGLYAEGDGSSRLPVTASPHPIQDQRILLGNVQVRPQN